MPDNLAPVGAFGGDLLDHPRQLAVVRKPLQFLFGQGQRTIQPPRLHQRIGKVLCKLRVIRLQAGSFDKMGNGLFVPPHLSQNESCNGMEVHDIGIGFHPELCFLQRLRKLFGAKIAHGSFFQGLR